MAITLKLWVSNQPGSDSDCTDEYVSKARAAGWTAPSGVFLDVAEQTLSGDYPEVVWRAYCLLADAVAEVGHGDDVGDDAGQPCLTACPVGLEGAAKSLARQESTSHETWSEFVAAVPALREASRRNRYRVSDDHACETITAESLDDACEAAEELWQDGSWDGKCRVDVRVVAIDEEGNETGESRWIEVECGEDPAPPACTEAEHDWRSPQCVVGGLDSNPGVWSTGGTTIVTRQVCRHCGCYRRETLHGAQRNPGECDTVEYEPADDASLAWIASQ